MKKIPSLRPYAPSEIGIDWSKQEEGWTALIDEELSQRLNRPYEVSEEKPAKNSDRINNEIYS